MKTATKFIVAFVVFVLALAALLPSGIDRPRPELHLLDNIKYIVLNQLDSGGTIPTNWMSITNSENWYRVLGICERYQLPPPEVSYAVLAHSVTNEATGGLVFLLSSKPVRCAARRPGRWALVAWPNETNNPIFQASRIWLAEDALKAEIRAQLTKPF